jgi:hypothetical protein
MMDLLLIPMMFTLLAMSPAAIGSTCQVSTVTESAVRELLEVICRQGGREAATELAQIGGKAAVRQLLERAMAEGGPALVERVAQYGTRFGPTAIKALERSPRQMIGALDQLSPDLLPAAVRAAARQPEAAARLVAAYGSDALELMARHSGVGTELAEKLGGDGVRLGQRLTTDQAITLARYADDIRVLPAPEQRQLLRAIEKTPGTVLGYLESHPRVLLTAGGVAVLIAAKDNLLGPPTSSPEPGTAAAGWIERTLSLMGGFFVRPMMVVLTILIGGLLGYIAIGLWAAFRRQNLRIQQEANRWRRR